MQIQQLLGAPIQEAMQATQFGQQLPLQAMGAAGGALGGIPVQPGTQAKSGAESASQVAQLGLMAYTGMNPGGKAGK
jgi:hypothetical protein